MYCMNLYIYIYICSYLSYSRFIHHLSHIHFIHTNMRELMHIWALTSWPWMPGCHRFSRPLAFSMKFFVDGLMPIRNSRLAKQQSGMWWRCFLSIMNHGSHVGNHRTITNRYGEIIREYTEYQGKSPSNVWSEPVNHETRWFLDFRSVLGRFGLHRGSCKSDPLANLRG